MLTEATPDAALVEESVVSHVAALAEMAKSFPSAIEDKKDEITPFLIDKVLMQPSMAEEVRYAVPLIQRQLLNRL